MIPHRFIFGHEILVWENNLGNLYAYKYVLSYEEVLKDTDIKITVSDTSTTYQAAETSFVFPNKRRVLTSWCVHTKKWSESFITLQTLKYYVESGAFINAEDFDDYVVEQKLTTIGKL